MTNTTRPAFTVTAPPPEETVRHILRCGRKGCKTVRAFDCPLTQEWHYNRGFPGVPGSATKHLITVVDTAKIPHIFCVQHRRNLLPERVKGYVTERPCDPRCTGAIGHVCECACGGKNHGGKHL